MFYCSVVSMSIALLCLGIDLCIGRWDNFEHRLTDFEPIHLSSVETTPAAGWTGVSIVIACF